MKKQTLSEEFRRMQKLAGIKLNEIKTKPLSHIFVLDIGIPLDTPNFTEIDDYLDKFPESDSGTGFGFRDYQINFATSEEANEVIDYLQNKFNIDFDSERDDDFYYSIYKKRIK